MKLFLYSTKRADLNILLEVVYNLQPTIIYGDYSYSVIRKLSVRVKEISKLIGFIPYLNPLGKIPSSLSTLLKEATIIPTRKFYNRLEPPRITINYHRQIAIKLMFAAIDNDSTFVITWNGAPQDPSLLVMKKAIQKEIPYYLIKSATGERAWIYP